MRVEFKPYDEYKQVDLPWLHSIPSHWTMTRNKNVLKLRKDIVGQSHSEYTLLSLTKQGIIARDLINAKGKFPKEFDSYQIVDPKDIVFCLFDIDETPRTVGISSLQGMITGAYTVFKTEDINEKYLYYYYLSLDNHKQLKPLYRGLRKVINTDTFLRTEMPYPHKDEQDQIVRYLDNILTKINKFIKTKKKLVEVLKEQKQVGIDKAVSNGLDLNVKMKSTGIDWLPEVPEHWRLVRTKNLISYRNVIVGDRSRDYKLLSLTTNGVIFRDLENAKGKFPSDFSTYQEINPGNLIFCLFDIDETPRTVGLSEISGMITGAYDVCEHIGSYSDIKYLYYYYLSIDNKKGFKPIYTGLRKVIPKDVFMQLHIPQPPLAEQHEIINHIEQKTTVIDKAIATTQKEIDLITEYRTRLISDVVTGKVDVRGIVVDDDVLEDLVEENDEELLDNESMLDEDGDENAD